ncbi:MAG: ATP-dependent zinc metalloprotease FtsH [Spirochaetes bacterium]|nr:ATP-dependent zinc metalloprotease FtsH [Spirochaetota bacterium]
MNGTSNNKNKKNPLKRGQLPGNDGSGGGQILILLVILVALLWFVMQFFRTSQTEVRTWTYSQFIENVTNNKVAEAKIVDNDVTGTYTETLNGATTNFAFKTYIPYQDPALLTLLSGHRVKFSGEQKKVDWFGMFLINILPFLVLAFVFWFFMFRNLQGANNKAMTFGKSRARQLRKEDVNVTFKDVEGCEEAKVELQEVIEFLKDPARFTKLGAKIPKGVLLVGPPGTGKTLLAKAVAGEANVPFFSMSGSEFVEMFVGVGASRVRDMFETGKRNAPCIMFIDELDAVGRTRGAGYGGGHDEREQTLNQMLVEMDGFSTQLGVIILAATNRPDVLDPALLRAGRFDRQVVVDIPDVKGREGILRIHAAKVQMEPDVDLKIIARSTPGFSGADLANVINEGALLAARRNKKAVGIAELEEAKDKVLMGPERRSLVISETEKRNTAYHESGHTLVAIYMKEDADALHKVTIIPRGRSLGSTWKLPTDGRYTADSQKILAEIAMLMGGRAAEELIFKTYTTGASNDIERATELARKMVCEWGMSRLGPLTYGQKEMPIFLGKEIARHKDYSEATAQKIDAEINFIILQQYAISKKIITDHTDQLELLAQALLEREVLGIDDIEKLLKMNIRKEEEKLAYVSKGYADTHEAMNAPAAAPATAESPTPAAPKKPRRKKEAPGGKQ